MSGVRYVVGDATKPQGVGPKIIAHVCNDIGAWGRGFVVSLSRRSMEPEVAYRSWYRSQQNFHLGAVQLVPVREGLWVANMVGQHGLRTPGGDPPIRYDAVDQALTRLRKHAEENQATVHMPRIGAGLAGGDWNKIEPLILGQLVERGVEVTVYDRRQTH